MTKDTRDVQVPVSDDQTAQAPREESWSEASYVPESAPIIQDPMRGAPSSPTPRRGLFQTPPMSSFVEDDAPPAFQLTSSPPLKRSKVGPDSSQPNDNRLPPGFIPHGPVVLDSEPDRIRGAEHNGAGIKRKTMVDTPRPSIGDRDGVTQAARSASEEETSSRASPDPKTTHHQDVDSNTTHSGESEELTGVCGHKSSQEL